MPYKNNAFINCPFDPEYRDLIERLLFILEFYGFKVNMSVSRTAGEERLANIIKHIKDSKFTFHDLSRHRATKKGEFARFNMPFELGIDFGCYNYQKNRKDKVIAILDSDAHAYDIHSSDLSGRDILTHNNDGDIFFTIIPLWLSKSTGVDYDSPKALQGYFIAWQSDYRRILKEKQYDLRSIKKIDLEIYKRLLNAWIPNWKKHNNYQI